MLANGFGSAQISEESIASLAFSLFGGRDRIRDEVAEVRLTEMPRRSGASSVSRATTAPSHTNRRLPFSRRLSGTRTVVAAFLRVAPAFRRFHKDRRQ